MKLFTRFAFVVLALTLLTGVSAWAQGTSLNGTIKDSSGAVIPGATITLTHKGTGATRTTSSGANGGYSLTQIDAADYRLEISMQGFKTIVQDPITMAVGLPSTFNASMEVGEVTEEIIVEGGIAGINTVDASLGTVIDGNQVGNLPSLNLNPAGLLSLQPGVAFIPAAADSPGGYDGISDFDGRSGSVNGARSDQSNITLDGVDVNDAENGFAFAGVLRATQASLQEFRVTTTNYNADQGRSSAAQIQLVTKSGTNDLHGSAYYTNRNEAYNATNFFNNAAGVEKGLFRRHIYGATLGGPIVPDRLFIFGNFERLEESLATSILRDVPSAAYRDGVLIYECDGGAAACPGNTALGLSGASYFADGKDGTAANGLPDPGWYAMTPGEFSALDPGLIGVNTNVINYLQQFPLPNASGNFDDVNLEGFRFNSPINNDFKTYIARVDLNIDQAGNHAFFIRGTLHGDTIVTSAPYYPGNPSNQSSLGSNRGIAMTYRAVINPSVINSIRYGYTRVGEKFSGQRNSEYANLRFIDELNGFDGTASTRTRHLPLHNIRDDVTVLQGNHSLSFGLDFRFMRNNRSTDVGAYHGFTVNPSWLENVGRNLQPGSIDCVNTVACAAVPAVAGGFAGDYAVAGANLFGIITQVDGNFNFLRDGSTQASGDAIKRRFAVNEFEGYFQDQWRVTPTITFTFGTRFYVSSPPWETEGLQVTPSPNLGAWFATRRQLALNGLPTNSAPPISFALGGPANDGANYYDWDWNNYSPRLALAWAPQIDNAFFGNGKMVIRGGYSLVYDRIGNAIATTFDAGGSFGMATGITSTFGACDEGGDPAKPDCARFTGPLDTAAATAISLPAAPPGGFPAVPPGADAFGNLAPGAFAISQALDSSISTPYSHVFDVSIAREIGNYTIEASYVGRRGRHLLISRDLAMPADICEPTSGRCYFKAAQDMIGAFETNTDITTIAADPFWETLFAGFGPTGVNGGFLPCDVTGHLLGPDGIDSTPDDIPNGGFSASQVGYDWINCVHPDTTVFPFVVDLFGFPSYMNSPSCTDLDGDGFGDCPFAQFDDQFATLNAWSSVARSEYHALQLSVRHRLTNGIQFAVNYTLSHSLDHSSTPERQGIFGFGVGGGSGTTINAWDLNKEYASSDFDMRHQLNYSWYAQLPIGHGKNLGSDVPGWVNQIIGGWEISGIFRANGGQVASAGNGFGTWPTNWQLTGNATCKGPGGSFTGVQVGPCPATQNVKDTVAGDGPNLFSDPDAAFDEFRKTLPGDRGGRNNIRGDNYMNIDFSLGKSFSLPMEGHSLKFRWEAFNVMNSAYFNATSLRASLSSQGSFGNYNAILGTPRQMQLTLRYEF